MTTPGPDERLSAYYDGELSAAERAEVERLLTERADLRSELGGLADLSQKLNELADDQPDFDLRPLLLKQIENSRRSPLPLVSAPTPIRRRAWMPLLLSTCSLMLLAAVMWPLLTTTDSSPQVASYESAADQLPRPQVAIVKSTIAEHSEEEASDSVVALDGSSTPNEASPPEEVGQADGTGPSVVLAQIERTRGIKAGEIISRMIESGNTPMLVEYTVVDVRRSSRNVEILLQEHKIQPLFSQESEDKPSDKSSVDNDDATASFKVFLLDAESQSLNSAIYQCKDLPDVVATNLVSLDRTSKEQFDRGGNSLDFGAYNPVLGRMSPSSPASVPSDAPVARSGFPVAVDKKSNASTPALQDSGGAEDSPSPARTSTEAVKSARDESSALSNDFAATSPPTIAGNSFVVENSQEVYEELQQILNQEKQFDSDALVERVPRQNSVPESDREAKMKSELDAFSLPEARNLSKNLPSFQSPTQLQTRSNRQRAILILRSQSQTQAAPQPPAPPLPVPAEPQD